MSSPLALAVAAWFARSRAAFEVSVPVVWYRRFLVKYVDWCNSVFVLRWLVRIAKFGLVIAAVGLAWNVDLRSVLRVPVPDAWQYGYLVALVVVLAVMFVVAVPGFILIRAVRAVLLAVGVALVPVAFLVVYMWSFHAIDIRTVRAAQFLSNGWESGHALPWSLAFVVVAVHAGWAGLAGWLLWHPERAVAVVHAVVVPLWIVARLAVPIVVTWVLVEEFFGAPSDVLVWARDRVRELAGVLPAVRAGFRTVDLVVGDATTYAVGILTGVVAVFGVWSALDLVRVVCMQFVRHVDGARELRRIFPLLPREGIAQGAGGGGADGDVVVDLPPVAAGAAGAGARFERSVDPVDAAERALRGELLSTQAAVLDAKRRALDEEITKLSDIDANLDLSLSSLERERELAGDSPLDRGPDAHRPAFEHADPVVPGARRPAPDPVELPPEKAPAVAAERPGPASATGGKADGGRVELPRPPGSGADRVVEYGDLDEVDPGAADALDRSDDDELGPEDFAPYGAGGSSLVDGGISDEPVDEDVDHGEYYEEVDVEPEDGGSRVSDDDLEASRPGGVDPRPVRRKPRRRRGEESSIVPPTAGGGPIRARAAHDSGERANTSRRVHKAHRIHARRSRRRSRCALHRPGRGARPAGEQALPGAGHPSPSGGGTRRRRRRMVGARVGARGWSGPGRRKVPRPNESAWAWTGGPVSFPVPPQTPQSNTPRRPVPAHP